jgi:hypothetical protein
MLKPYAACLFAILVVSVGLVSAHGNNEHVMGTITAINGDHVTIQTQDGKSQMVMLAKTTKYFIDKKTAKAADMKVGSRVVVDVKMDPKMKMYSALEVKIGVTTPVKTDTKAVKPAGSGEKHSDHK